MNNFMDDKNLLILQSITCEDIIDENSYIYCLEDKNEMTKIQKCTVKIYDSNL
jgi:hypothetical protein